MKTAALAVIVSVNAFVLAGPLNPPAGAITSTNKTLAEDEPRIAINATNTPGNSSTVYRIIQAGSYYLTANVVGVANRNGIEISSSGVTLDLNGFEVIGNGNASGDFDGIRVTVSTKNVTICNGHVRNWGDDGIEIPNFANSAGARVEDVQSTGNSGSGIACSTSNGVVLNCTASENGSTGISATRLIRGCSALDNAGSGLSVGQGGSIIDSLAFSNEGNGLFTGFGCVVTNCVSDNNTGDGIEASNGTTISDSSFYANGGAGVNVFSSVTIRNCVCAGNQTYGIDSDTACLIEGNLVRSNVLEGIRTGSSGVVRNNIASSNALGSAEVGAGIHVTGSLTRVEGNQCVDNDFGIDIDGTGNIIIRNTCSSNTQAFVIGPDNFYGPIIDRRIPGAIAGTAAVIGFSAASTMGSSDGNVNIAQ